MCSDVTVGAGLCSILRRSGGGMGDDFLVIPIFLLLLYAYTSMYLSNSIILRLASRSPGSASGA